jgi:retron-type reverse transcriptase
MDTDVKSVSSFFVCKTRGRPVALFDLLKRLFGGGERGYGRAKAPGNLNIDELARRLDVTADELRAVQPCYRRFTMPKRSGSPRSISAPRDGLKALQRRILRRVLGRLARHPAALGFERGQSIVTHARCHVGRAVVVRMDLKEFFDSTTAERVGRYFRAIGWDKEASRLLVRLCTDRNGLPQGAPTSPRLSNLVNYRLDARLAGLARKLAAIYTRYADDLTFSFATDDPAAIHAAIRSAKLIVEAEGYRLHQRKKLRIRRRHGRQLVTGLVVNERVNLPREVRRRLRAVKHRLANGRESTLTPAQLAGWGALQAMIATQAGGGNT